MLQAQVLDMLKDGDEVSVMPLAGRDELRTVGFTRTFPQAREEVERITSSQDRADIPTTLKQAEALFQDATHALREIYIVSDAQRSTLLRDGIDTTLSLETDVSSVPCQDRRWIVRIWSRTFRSTPSI